MRRFYLFIMALFGLTGVLSCSKQPLLPEETVFYLNSFETVSDTTGWHGLTDRMFVPDPAPGGGKKSLRIGGGCIQPIAWMEFPPAHIERKFRLSCWAKIHQESQTGGVLIANMDGETKIVAAELSMTGQTWNLYQSEKPLICPPGKKLRVEISIGGIIYASMQIDVLKIELIN